MDAQEIFDTVVTHLIKQGGPAMGYDPNLHYVDEHEDEPMCLYRGPGGTKCAAGCLIPDDVYSPKMENVAISLVIKTTPELAFLNSNVRLINELQMIHDANIHHKDDDTFNMEALFVAFDDIANEFSLNKGAYRG